MKKEEQRLLEQGIADYVNAQNAINAFGSLVQSKCRRVVRDNLKALASALGIELSDQKFIDLKFTNGSDFELGVKFDHKDAGITWAALGQTLAWWLDDGRTETGLCFWVWSKRKNIERLAQVLDKKRIEHKRHENEGIYLWDKVTPVEVARIDNKLDTMMNNWIALWRKVGGVKAMWAK